MNCDLLPCQQGWFSPGSSGFHPENHPCCMVPDILFCILIYMYVFIYITKVTSNVKQCNPCLTAVWVVFPRELRFPPP